MTTVACIVPTNAATARPPIVHAELQRQPASTAADWMDAVAAECRRHATLCPPIVDFLKRTGLLSRCVFLAADAGGPLAFKHIGQPSITVMGRAWARRNLGQPVADSDGSDFGDAMAASYVEVIETGESVVNRVQLSGLSRPLVYLHSLFGWKAPDGRRAVLSCVQL